MVSQEYDFKPIGNEYEFTNTDYMHFCLTDTRKLLEITELTHLQIRGLMKLRKEYTHYRDSAIKNGEEISRFPRKIYVPKDIAERINKLELRDRRITKLKMKLNRQ